MAEKALNYFQQALTIDEAVFGPENPKVGIRLNNLGSTYQNLGNKHKAKKCFERAYGIFETSLGKEHPHTIAVKNLGRNS